ncbi:hypothetical protein BH10PSE11_BH10PSE11_08290 [soil metagenome]
MGNLQAAWEAKRNRMTCRRGHALPPYAGYGTHRQCKTCDKEQRALRLTRLLNGTQPLGKSRSSLKPRTHCPSGHPYSGLNLRISYRGNKVCRTCANAASARWKLEKLARGENPSRFKPQEKSIKKAAISAGRGLLLSQTRKASGGMGISPNTLINIKLWYPARWQPIAEQFAENKKVQSLNKALGVPTLRRPQGPINLTPAESTALFHLAYRLMPSGISDDHRDDAAAEMMKAVIEGRLDILNVNRKAANWFVGREFNCSHNSWGPKSLDERSFADGKRTLVDTVSVGLWD